MRPLPRRTAILLCLLAALLPFTARALPEASYQATNWDQEMSLPPNSYRATKPIHLNGNFAVKTQPGTLIDRISFEGNSGVQHWHIEGATLRNVRIGVKMNGNGHGIDSVFEDCDFNKDDNWYMDWWSTRWKFDNCIFTKKFVRGFLPPLDYSAHATKCTFYGVKLPGVGFKGNPADYLQKGEMVFEQCRFVDCDVPQTFLAGTVDCVFESCRFEPKNKVNWPKETRPIKVKAFYAGTGGEPSSFLNGPLSVEFASAPRTAVYGSTLPHTQSGGRVTLTKTRLNDQFVAMGTVPKKASEIVDVAAATTPAPAVAPVVAPIAVAAPTGAEIRGLEEIFRAMPSNVEVLVGGEPNAAGVEAANLWLAKNCAGRPAALRMGLESLQAVREGNDAFQTTSRAQGVLYHGATIPARTVGMFRAVDALPLRQVQVGGDFNLRGTVRKAEFVGRGHALTFTMIVGEASVPATLVAAPTVPAAPTPAAPAPTKQTPDYFGTQSGPGGRITFPPPTPLPVP